MSNITNLNDLLLEQAREVYDAEKQQLEAMQEIAGKIHSGKLKEAVQEHVARTEIHLQRLETVFNRQHKLVTGEQSLTMKALVRELIETVNRSSDPAIRDAGFISLLQQIAHFEIALYGTLCAFAKKLKQDKMAGILHETLEEEKDFDQKLTELADDINEKAVTGFIL